MNIDELTLGQVKELRDTFGGACSTPADSAWKVGEKVFIRSVTFYYTGRVARIYKDAIELEEAAWIASTGRFHDALVSGEFSEVEPFPNGVKVALGGIIDWTTWTNDLPGAQK